MAIKLSNHLNNVNTYLRIFNINVWPQMNQKNTPTPHIYLGMAISGKEDEYYKLQASIFSLALMKTEWVNICT